MAGFTTRWTVAGDATARTITLPLHNSGVFNCTVNWGDGTPDSTVIAFNDANRIHTYAANGTYDIEITGECPAWSINAGVDQAKIIAVVDWGDAVDFGGFQYLTNGFYNCTNLASLGIGKIQAKAGLTTLFQTFRGCSSLASIPSGIFDNCVNLSTGGFNTTFLLCTGLLTIPSGLFDYNINVSTEGFFNAFYGCTNLTTIPAGLFDYNVNVSTNGFYSTFHSCSNLTSIPAELFKYNVLCDNFTYCFYQCTKAQLNKNIFYSEGEQSTRFFNRTSNFTGCFQRLSFTGVQGTAPDLWNCNYGSGTLTSLSCYSSAGNSATSLTNYSIIPIAWGGPYNGLGYWTNRKDIIQGLRAEGVLALYHDYRSGRTYDFSGNGNHGVATGANFNKKGAIFTPIAGNITVPYSASLSSSGLTLIASVDFPDFVSQDRLATRRVGTTTFDWYRDTVLLRIYDGTFFRNISFTQNKGVVGFSATAGGIPEGYLNGNYAGSYSGSISLTSTVHPLVIGNFSGIANLTNKIIHYFVLISRPLTATEHSVLYSELENRIWPTKGLTPGAFMP